MTRQHHILASGLEFPEGPVPLASGEVLVVEIARQTLTRVAQDGACEVVAHLGGGPNGAAIGPDGHAYICNNGGFVWDRSGPTPQPLGTPSDYRHGSIQKVDLSTGEAETLYTHCGDVSLKAPNDLVFDQDGGFWFTDTGKRHERHMDVGGIYYAKANGSEIIEALFPTDTANGVGLSPNGKTLYMAETMTGRLWHYPVLGPGQLAGPTSFFDGSGVLYGAGGYDLFDSLAVEAGGNICVAALSRGGIHVISPTGVLLETVDLQAGTTNIAFGGPGQRTAYITQGATGELVKMDWPRPGHPLAYTA